MNTLFFLQRIDRDCIAISAIDHQIFETASVEDIVATHAGHTIGAGCCLEAVCGCDRAASVSIKVVPIGAESASAVFGVGRAVLDLRSRGNHRTALRVGEEEGFSNAD